VAERPFDDLDGLGREIDRLWAKVASSSVSDLDAPVPPAPPFSGEASPSKQMAWETVSLLKRQHQNESRSWTELLEAKEQALRALKERCARLTAENAALAQGARAAEAQALERTLQVNAQLEAGMRGLEADRAQREDELRSLRALLDQTRQRLAAEDARWKAEQRQWEKKEQQFLLDLRELQALSARYQDESGRAVDETRRLNDSLKEAKNALEKTLAELLRERQERQRTEAEREKALKKVDETQSHLGELEKLWEEERKQWRELWDRERSTWETQRSEFSNWEQRLRQERQAWHAELEAKEKDQLVFTERMTQALRETGELSTRVSAAMRAQTAARSSRKVWAAAAAALALAFAAPPVYRYATRHHFAAVSTQSVGAGSPTALAFDGTMAWVASWDGRLLSFDPQNFEVPVRSAAPADLAPYHPVSMAFGTDVLWTLDAARARIVRHRAADPSKVLATRPTPGPAPTALAFDGQSLWSYDAVTRSLYQHGSDEGASKSYALDEGGVVTAMCWVGDKLWVFDAKSKQLVEFELKDGLFRALERDALQEPVTALVAGSGLVDGRRRAQLWALVGPAGSRQSPAVIKYGY
jgi:hypothetical protein